MTHEGEGRLLLDQIRDISKDILTNLMEVDDKLIKIQELIKTNQEINKDKLLEAIDDIRLVIGVVEKEDTQEMEEEEILQSIMQKLNSLISMTLG